MNPGARVVVVGAGGNIGSHLVPHLARMPEIGRLTLVDRDTYEERNRGNQDLPGRSARRSKAAAQGQRARAVNPGLSVRALRADVESMPVAALRGDLMLACLDSRRARQAVNQAAWRLGVPWIDAGVCADGLLARITCFVPGEGAPCLECGWDAADYAALEQCYACAADGSRAPPTGAPSSLGALAASLLALECRKHLTGAGRPLPPGSSVVVDAAQHRHFVTAARHNPACRMTDHRPWCIEPLDGPNRSLAAVLQVGGERLGVVSPTLRVDGRWFVMEMRCTRCARVRRPLRLAGRLTPAHQRCAGCGAPTAAAGFGLTEWLGAGQLTGRQLERPLTAFGLRAGDVVSLGAHGCERHFEIVEP